ncbi:hypothetical protein GCM10023224_14480 [Streptomonospora halophila]|uniref:Uncharacterized protein n=1 Tax=Streptomonospora halophila TaxID=427369 RepID=A0ABP9GA53_9ACTN
MVLMGRLRELAQAQLGVSHPRRPAVQRRDERAPTNRRDTPVQRPSHPSAPRLSNRIPQGRRRGGETALAPRPGRSEIGVETIMTSDMERHRWWRRPGTWRFAEILARALLELIRRL